MLLTRATVSHPSPARPIVQSAATLNPIHRAFTSRNPALYILSRRAQTTMATLPLFAFTGSPSPGKYGPRTGRIHIDREDGTPIIHTDTPALLTATSRGIVPHLSRDNVHLTQAIRHLQLPFESFLDRNPPVLTLAGGTHPLHTFLGFNPDNHVAILTLRDPSDGRKMPPNGNDFVSAQCTRGVRKVNLPAWKNYVAQCKPDLVVALSDTPFTPAPHSQKRLTKSIERSIAWLADFLRVPPGDPDPTRPRNVLVHLAGGIETSARSEFADRLSEPIEQKDAPGLSPPLNTLDNGVAGYVFDLLPLHTALAVEASRTHGLPSSDDELLHASDHQRSSPKTSRALAELFRTSLDPLPADKPRIINSPVSPHEILRLVRDVGVDLVDGFWAQRAADIGIALDFRFPVPHPPTSESSAESVPLPPTRKNGKLDLGHNLFDALYRHDHVRLASSFLDGKSAQQEQLTPNLTSPPVCYCHACSPRSPASRMLHSAVDAHAWADLPPSALQPPFVRSYVHHLLHTHEMSAHSLLAMHNLTVFAGFLSGIREVLARGESGRDEFEREVERFEETYDEEMALWDEAEKMWLGVEHARGKGRLAREKEKQAVSTIGTAVDL
ncbi:tRNA-guanine(15) transglycosylase-like protein [Ganoderma leucocontextum]|nr:tRNA-guanine(15) transglycosylase-like protein [Ganoderma leucocontextum]